MKDHPIIFSGPMVRALLDGRKTQTRRLFKGTVPSAPAMDAIHPNNIARHPAPYLDAYCSEQMTPTNPRRMSERWCWWTRDDRQCLPTFRVGFKPGDRLWVRESVTRFDKGTCDQHCWYRAGGNGPPFNYSVPVERAAGKPDGEWPLAEGPAGGKPYSVTAIHMPRFMSRLTLIVTAVKIERLHEITNEEAEFEGVKCDMSVRGFREHFSELWNRLHGPKSWDGNPYVVALTFTVHKQNIDSLPKSEAA